MVLERKEGSWILVVSLGNVMEGNCHFSPRKLRAARERVMVRILSVIDMN